MDRRTKLLILFAFGILSIVGILFFLFRPTGESPPAPVNANTPVEGGLNVNAAPPPSANVNVAPPPPREVTEADRNRSAAQIAATTFAERLGSYSSQNALSNFDDLEPLMVPLTYAYLQGSYRGEIEASFPEGGAYYGVTTRVVKATFVSFDAQSAQLKLNVQKAESGTVTQTSYPSLNVELTRTGSAWLVSRFEWE